ncbi:MAG: tripartite tricarboxylate transporter TctB family protein [Herbinix sp.]|nr:tripartite tricarboxylate transporter TctB family protein [Herbinix sp.]
MSDYQKNMLSGAIFFLFGIVLLFAIPFTIQQGNLSAVGPRAFPNFIGYTMVFLSGAHLVITFISNKLSSKKTNEKDDVIKNGKECSSQGLKDEIRVIVLGIIMLLYVLTFENLGFFASTFIASTLSLILFKVHKWYHYLAVYGSITLIYLGFTKLLFVMLP